MPRSRSSLCLAPPPASGRGLVRWPVLCAVLPAPDPQGRWRHRADHDRLVALALGTPGFFLFGALSDKIGRKPIILAGCPDRGADVLPDLPDALRLANPKLEEAIASVTGDRDRRSRRAARSFNPRHRDVHHQPCDTARDPRSSNQSVNYRPQDGRSGTRCRINARCADADAKATTRTSPRPALTAIKKQGCRPRHRTRLTSTGPQVAR